MAFFEVEPWGSEVEFLRAGIVASTIVNAAPNRKRGSKAATPKDFMPKPKVDQVRVDRKNLRADFFGVFNRDSAGKKREGVEP